MIRQNYVLSTKMFVWLSIADSAAVSKFQPCNIVPHFQSPRVAVLCPVSCTDVQLRNVGLIVNHPSWYDRIGLRIRNTEKFSVPAACRHS